MLLNSDTAVKVAHDIIHDCEEFFAKWKLLLAPREECPEGYVDFEFADGMLIRIPCAWTFEGTDTPEVPVLLFKNGEQTAEMTVASKAVTVGSIVGAESTVPITFGDITANYLMGLSNGGDARLTVINAAISRLVGYAYTISQSTIKNLKVEDSATIDGGTISSIDSSGGTISADLDELRSDSFIVESLTCGGEQIIATEKYNATYEDAYPQPTGARYSSHIPLIGISRSNYAPVNGFEDPLAVNPFFPDFIYVTSGGVPAWRPSVVWVPSDTAPTGKSWRDEDGLYWKPVTVRSSASQYGNVSSVYPPRCWTENDNTPILYPMKAEVDGLVVTVKIIGNLYVTFAVTDRYTYQTDDTWSWTPGEVKGFTGPCMLQFLVKREIIRVGGVINAVEYQFLPLGGANG